MTDYLDLNRSIPAFRRAVPQHLQPFIRTPSGRPRTEWRFSLKTSDKALARELCRLEAVKTDALIREAEAKREAWLRENAKSPQQRERERVQWEAEREQEDARSRELFIEHAEFEEREPMRQAFINTLGRPRGELTDAEAALRDLIPDEEFAAPEVKAARQAQVEAEWRAGAADVAARFRSLRSGVASNPATRTILQLFEGYAAEAALQPATRKRWQPVFEHLGAHLGHDDVERITRGDILSWKQALQSEKGEDGKAVRGARTIREVYLAAVKAAFTWGVENGWLAANPAEKVTQRVPKKIRLRDPDFTDHEAKLILRNALLPQSDKLSPEHALARRWVPWICAYTGARVNEITQMRAQDVRQIGGVWTIRITPEAGSQKQGEARVVPLHSHLVEQGFPDVAVRVGKGPLFYDPKRSKGGAAANPQNKKVGERLAKWVRTIGVTDREVQPNHGWRHLFKSRARNAGMDLDAREAIPGHEPGTEGRKYGVNDIPFLSAEVEKFPRFTP